LKVMHIQSHQIHHLKSYSQLVLVITTSTACGVDEKAKLADWRDFSTFDGNVLAALTKSCSSQ
jgi:hypothetical protein